MEIIDDPTQYINAYIDIFSQTTDFNLKDIIKL